MIEQYTQFALYRSFLISVACSESTILKPCFETKSIRTIWSPVNYSLEVSNADLFVNVDFLLILANYPGMLRLCKFVSNNRKEDPCPQTMQCHLLNPKYIKKNLRSHPTQQHFTNGGSSRRVRSYYLCLPVSGSTVSVSSQSMLIGECFGLVSYATVSGFAGLFTIKLAPLVQQEH